MFQIEWLLTFGFIAYLLGSIPNAVWIGKAFFGKDVRDYGSGNAGATNVFRVLGKGPGTVVLLLDILKGFLAAKLVIGYEYFQNSEISQIGEYQKVNLMLGYGMAAVLGHLFPIFAGFRGGKGIATLGGLIIAINYWIALIAIGLFLVILFSTRFVSVGSMLAGLSIPVLFVKIFGIEHPEYKQPTVIAFTIAISVLVVYTHRKNIQRLIHGNENKAKLLPKHRNHA